MNGFFFPCGDERSGSDRRARETSRFSLRASLRAFGAAHCAYHAASRPSGAVASLDHSMWFHAPFRADEWMLYDMRSPRLVDSRGLIFGSVYQDGVLVATVAQEGLLRLKRD